MNGADDFEDVLKAHEEKDVRALARQVHTVCKNKGLSLAVAESVTGGLISSEITRVPGASAFFLGGVVCYQAKAKYLLVNVNPKTIADHGAVSKEVTREMAVGVKKRMQADIGLAVTGVAGPGPGTFPNTGLPGTVFVAIATDSGMVLKQFQLTGTREEVREAAVETSLRLLSITIGN